MATVPLHDATEPPHPVRNVVVVAGCALFLLGLVVVGALAVSQLLHLAVWAARG